MPESDPLASKPYDKTGTVMQGVDTIVAMPQWYVNYNLGNLLKQGTTADGKSLREVKLTYTSGVMWLEGTIAKLWTELFVQGSASKVKFVLQFLAGTMQYWDVTQNPPVKQSCDIGGLQFGFEVDLSVEDVANDQTLPVAVKKRVTELLTDLGPGGFRIQHLFMDVQNAALDQYDPTATKFPATMPASATAAFPSYLKTYLAELHAVGGNTLGYAISVDKTADLPATFAPTGLEFVINQYRSSSSLASANPDLDSLMYLLMTKGTAFPTNLSAWWGNFVVPGDDAGGWYGTIAVANKLFVKEFLLPRLAPLVLKYWKLENRDDGLDPRYTEQTGSFTETPLGGKWTSGGQTSRSHRTNTWSNDDIDYNMTISAELTITPGAGTIMITRNTDFDLRYTHWYGIEKHAASDEFHMWYNFPLTITITLLGTQDAQLQVATTKKTRDPDPGMNYADPYQWDIVKTEGSYTVWTSINDDMAGALGRAANMAMPEGLMPEIEKAITEQLNLKPFVFPGSAQLFMADPQFNDAGDLLLGLQYKV